MEPTPNRSSKDTAFSLIFSKEKYQRDVVHHLFGGRLDGEKIEMITMRNVFLRTWYNDLGLLVGDTLVLLVEAQSTEPANIAIRMLTYYAETLNVYLSSRVQQAKLYGVKKLALPNISLFCVYTGTKPVPRQYRLSDHFEEVGGKTCGCEVIVNIITKDSAEAQGATRDYIRFCEILSGACREVHGAAEIAQHVIDRCLAEGIFVDIMSEEEGKIMKYLNDEEYQRMLTESLIAEEREEATAKANAKAMQREKALLAIVDLIYEGLSREEILARTKVDVLTVSSLKERYERVQGKKKPSGREIDNKNIQKMKLD